MSLLENTFGGIDFADTTVTVRILFIVILVIAFLVIVAIFSFLGLIIPKSKMQDIQTIDKAIRRLKKLMFFNKVALCVNSVILIIMAILHFAKIMEIFEPPLIWITAIATSIMPILLMAVFGSHGVSENQTKLQHLFRLRHKITSGQK